MTLNTDKKLVIVHFNRRNNGGNLALKDFADNFCEYMGYRRSEVFFSENPVATIKAIFLKDLIVFSNPILLIFFCFKKRSVYFMQSIEEKLFDKEDFNPFVVFFYAKIIMFCLNISRNIKVFNSSYTCAHYSKLGRTLGWYSVVDNLYHKSFEINKKNKTLKNDNQCIWIGTKHKRKKFDDLLKIAVNNSQYSFICVFSGEPPIVDLPDNVIIKKNMKHSEVKMLVSQSRFSIVTSIFESLCLPVYEGLLFENTILAAQASYIEKNGLKNHINTFVDASDVDLRYVKRSDYYEFKNPLPMNSSIFKKVLCEI
jgi:hypothetical protein